MSGVRSALALCQAGYRVEGRELTSEYLHLHPAGTFDAEARAAGMAVVFDAHDEVGAAVLAAAG
jgi:hypothetical protein